MVKCLGRRLAFTMVLREHFSIDFYFLCASVSVVRRPMSVAIQSIPCQQRTTDYGQPTNRKGSRRCALKLPMRGDPMCPNCHRAAGKPLLECAQSNSHGHNEFRRRAVEEQESGGRDQGSGIRGQLQRTTLVLARSPDRASRSTIGLHATERRPAVEGVRGREATAQRTPPHN
jgi:hypothetical protein